MKHIKLIPQTTMYSTHWVVEGKESCTVVTCAGEYITRFNGHIIHTSEYCGETMNFLNEYFALWLAN